MPLTAASERELLHTRRVECRGYQRSDGLWDIEGHLIDLKSYTWQSDDRGEVRPGEPLHEMWLRLTIDEDLLIRAVEAASDYSPFRACPAVVPHFAALEGLRIGPGWRKKVRELLGGTKGCTHLVELLTPLATTAYQTIYSARARRAQKEPGRKPDHIDTCHALASDGEVVKRYWPSFYTGT
ncbi:MAG TPA: DUF2889 domain-containing protein [Alphaproteobacteria bacterium]|nr:DUF2889 domain-containing protein [Alphaproteobacteria bacterium]